MADVFDAGVARLIDPIQASDFLSNYWEKKPLVVCRDRSDYFASLISIEQIATLITTADLPSSALDVANAGSPVNRTEFVAPNGAVDILRVYQLFSQGATILLHELQRWVPSLALLCRAMEKEFSAPFQTNIYMTPSDEKGFRAHYDTHDVFLLQISGAKEWTICPSPIELPLRNQPFDSDVHPVGDKLLTCELHAGDLLYIPRGFIHHARSLNEISLHVTLGALSYTWADVFADVVSELSLSDPAFRRALPVDFARSQFNPVLARDVFADLLRHAGNNAILDLVIGRLADALVIGRRPLVPGQMGQLSQLPKLSILHQAGPRPGLLYRLRIKDDALTILCHGREISLPLETVDAVKFALGEPLYVIRDLPGELDEDGKLVLVRRLIQEGMIMCYSFSQRSP